MTSKFTYKSLTYLVMGAIGGFIGFLLTIITDLLLENNGIPSDGFGTGDWVIVIMMAVFVSLFLSPLVYIKFVEDIRASAVERKGASFNSNSNTLEIERRGRYLKDLLKVGSAKITNYKYVDPKLVYTGATVGGVSMGGFHVEEGGYRDEVLQTDTYQLIYKDPWTELNYPVEWIDLSADCLNAAKKDPKISKLVFRNSICLTGASDSTWSKLTKDGVLSQDLAKANYGAQQAALSKYQLSQEDLWYIRRWLCKKK